MCEWVKAKEKLELDYPHTGYFLRSNECSQLLITLGSTSKAAIAPCADAGKCFSESFEPSFPMLCHILWAFEIFSPRAMLFVWGLGLVSSSWGCVKHLESSDECSKMSAWLQKLSLV